MKILYSLVAMLMLVAGMVSATAFEVIKQVDVTGDWVWDGGSWTKPMPRPITATYSFNAVSPSATIATYGETEKLGTPWKYSLDMSLGANSAGTSNSLLSAITVNDPATTPATGGYTQYGFHSESAGDFSASSITVTGGGAVTLGVSTIFDTGFTQINQVRINE